MEDPLKKVASRLKGLRQEKQWSLDVASQETGVSKAMLGQIERGESSPTIATLWKIASGFNTSFSSFIEEPPITSTAPIHRITELKELHPQDDKIRVMPLFAFDESLQFEMFVIELLPGCEHLSPPHTGDVTEHVIATEGQMEVLVGEAWYPLKQHEALQFKADQRHGYRNTSDKTAIIYDIIHYQ